MYEGTVVMGDTYKNDLYYCFLPGQKYLVERFLHTLFPGEITKMDGKPDYMQGLTIFPKSTMSQFEYRLRLFTMRAVIELPFNHLFFPLVKEHLKLKDDDVDGLWSLFVFLQNVNPYYSKVWDLLYDHDHDSNFMLSHSLLPFEKIKDWRNYGLVCNSIQVFDGKPITWLSELKILIEKESPKVPNTPALRKEAVAKLADQYKEFKTIFCG